MQEMTKEYVSRIIQEENLWKEGETDTFSFMMSQMWEFILRKEEKMYEPFKYSLSGKKIGTYEIWSRRYTSMEAAFLHIVNCLNENVNIRDKYRSIEEWLLEGQ